MKSAKTQTGAALAELALILPILLIFIGGLIDIGSILFQVILASDATRYGARKAALYALDSPDGVDCNVLRYQANKSTKDYMLNTLKIPQQQWEITDGSSNICEFHSDEMDISLTIVTQNVQIKSSILKTCLFCFLAPLTRLYPEARTTYIIPGGCCEGLNPDGTCVDVPDVC